MTESTFWAGIRPKLLPYGDLERIENRVNIGTPDVNYCLLRVEGWIELKYKDEWPVREATPFRLPHFTIEQLLWQERRHRAGGRVCLLAQVGIDYMILPPWHLRTVFDGATREVYMTLAVVVGSRVFPTRDVVRWLTGRSHAKPSANRLG